MGIPDGLPDTVWESGAAETMALWESLLLHQLSGASLHLGAIWTQLPVPIFAIPFSALIPPFWSLLLACFGFHGDLNKLEVSVKILCS